MRFATFTIFLALAICLSGCDWVGQKLSFGKKQPTPITKPASQPAGGTATRPAGKTPVAATGPAAQTRPGQQTAANKPPVSQTPTNKPPPGQTKPDPTAPGQKTAATKPATRPADAKQVAATSPAKPLKPTTVSLAENNQYKLSPTDNTSRPATAPKEIKGPVSLTDLSTGGSTGQPVKTPNLTAVNIDEGVPQPATKPADPQTRPAIQIIAMGDPATQPGTQPVAVNNPTNPDVTIDIDSLSSVKRPPATPKTSRNPDQADPQKSPENADEPASTAKIEIKIIPLPPARDYAVGQTEKINGVVMVINKVYITVGDLLAESHDDLSGISRNASEDAFRTKAHEILNADLHRLATRTMLLGEAKAKIEEDDTKEIDKEIEDAQRELIANYGTRSKLEQMLASAGKTLEGVLQRHRDSLMIEKYLRRKLIPAIVINPRMLEDYYRKHQGEFVTAKKVQMQIIFVPFSKFISQAPAGQPTQQEIQASKIKAKQEIDQAAAELMSGADFAAVARKYRNTSAGGEDGTWPMMEKGNFREQKVEDVAFALPEGKVSPVFETDTGYYIVKAKKVQEGAVVDFVEAQETIAEKLRMEQFHKLSEKYYERIGRSSANSVVEDGFKVALDCAVERYFKK
ncbi:MAG: peptidyl-prolyl cis-trans isomerase [Planctomycetes bacterium]|nr:peptidyl-prolyl cis-trans isomerase [Planctomycetota bacterium]